MQIDNPNGTQELYESVRSEIGLTQPAGGKAHLAGPLPGGGWRVIEVWDSIEEASAFLRDHLAPALRAAIPVPIMLGARPSGARAGAVGPRAPCPRRSRS